MEDEDDGHLDQARELSSFEKFKQMVRQDLQAGGDDVFNFEVDIEIE